MAYRLGVDVGGTFTDLILIRERDGQVFTAKLPSSPEDPSAAVFRGIEKICSQSGVDRREITRVMHGTTVATNAVLTGDGARVGLITTKGYKQVLRRAIPLLRAAEVEAVTVCLINSFASGAHERRVREILTEELPGVPVSISSEVIPEMQEYERAITTVARIFDRARLRAGDRLVGPAIVTEMDSTTLILPNHAGAVDQFGNILIRPHTH